MKKVFILMLGLIAGTASFAQSTASEGPEMTVSITTDQKLKVVVAPKESTATITLRDSQGHVLYSTNVALNNGLYQKFDINELEAGAYELAVTVGKEATVNQFEIAEQPAHKLVALRS